MPVLIQRAFSAGEIGPHLYGRADQAKYQTGLKTCRNMVPQMFGSVQNRAGTKYVATVKDSTKAVRLLRFVFSNTLGNAYVIEAGPLYFRFYKLSARIATSGVTAWKANATITGVTQANPAVVSSTAHGYVNGDSVVISGVVGMTQLNGNTYVVAGATANTFQLSGIDSTGYTAYGSAGIASRPYALADLVTLAGVTYYCILAHSNHTPANATYWYPQTGTIYEIPTPYAEADLFGLQLAQSGDVVTIVHPSYAVYELNRYADTKWTLTPAVFGSPSTAPTNIAGSGTAGSNTFKYAVTAVDAKGSESLAGTSAAVIATITNMVRTLPSPFHPVITVTAVAHGLSTGDQVIFNGIIGSPDPTYSGPASMNGRIYTIDKVDADHFTVRNGTWSLFGTYGSGGTAALTGIGISAVKPPSDTTAITLTWTGVDNAKTYNVYRELNGIMGFVGSASNATFQDVGYAPDINTRPPESQTVFAVDNDFPSTAGYYQQRLCFSGSNNEPETVRTSRIGDLHNFNTSTPIHDDDAVTFEIAGLEVARVAHLIDLGKLVILTDSGEYVASGDPSGSLIPSAINLRQQGHIGAAAMKPIVIGNTALYVQARGAYVRDLRYNFQTDGYVGNSLSIFATHLFDGFTLTDWAYQHVPDSIVWAVRSDGTLLSLTYVLEHEVVAWAHHDTATKAGMSFFESVVCLPEGTEDALYVLVRRTINGSSVRMVERLAPRLIQDVAVDAHFVDCGIVIDGRNTGATTLAISGGTTWGVAEALTLTASAPTFSAGDVGNEFIVNVVDGYGVVTDTVRIQVDAYASTTVVTGRPSKTVPAALRSAAKATWERAVAVATGLTHLEGETVSILGDGNVATGLTVASGQVTLPHPYAVIHVGLPIVADLQTLDLEIVNQESLQGKSIIVNRAILKVESSRSIKVGPDENNLTEAKQRDNEVWDAPVALDTGIIDLRLSSAWGKAGRIFVRQDNPLPLTLLSAALSGTLGGL